MIVSRRSLLMATPSGAVMRAGAYAASPAAVRARVLGEATKRFATLTGERAGAPITR
jgi:hypothetical protein